jgi:hypothetical protein
MITARALVGDNARGMAIATDCTANMWLFQPGWPPPSAMEHPRWPLHRYVLEPD